MNYRRTFRNLFVGLLCGAALCVPTLRAGDAAFVDIIGFSADGTHFAFQQSGEQDGSGYGYSDLFIVNVLKNEWATKPERYQTTDEEMMAAVESGNLDSVSAEAIGRKVRIKAMPSLRSFGLDSAEEGFTLYEDYSQPELGQFSACDKKSFHIESAQIIADLHVRGLPIVGSSNFYGDEPLKLLEVSLQYSDGEKEILQLDEKLPHHRRMAYDYDISGVYIGGPMSNSLAIIIGYHEPGFEGPDKRYLVVTKDIMADNFRSSETTSKASAMNVEGVCIAETSLNIRQSPSTASPVIGSLYPEEPVWLIREHHAGGRAWYEVSWKGQQGWVAADYITIPEWNE